MTAPQHAVGEDRGSIMMRPAESLEARERFFQKVACLLHQRRAEAGLSLAEYIRQRIAPKPWVPTRREYRAARRAAVAAQECRAFPCQMCRADGHFCPATRLGFEQEGVCENWCAACYAGRKCLPGKGAIDFGGGNRKRVQR
jgi:hypothetical protein